MTNPYQVRFLGYLAGKRTTMKTPDPVAKEVVRRLNKLIALAGEAYQNYLTGGKTFFYARQLWESNAAIKNLVVKEVDVLPAGPKEDALALLPHIEVWMEKWLALELELKPEATTVFVFENEVRFNRGAAQRLAAFEREQ